MYLLVYKTINVSAMEQHHHTPPPYIAMANALQQAMFYCFNDASERIPVGRIEAFNFIDDNTIQLSTNYFPVTEKSWNVFAAELHFYKKGMPESLQLHGIAIFENMAEGKVQFNVKNAAYFVNSKQVKPDQSFIATLLKPYLYFYKKSTELLQFTFKKKSTSGIFN